MEKAKWKPKKCGKEHRVKTPKYKLVKMKKRGKIYSYCAICKKGIHDLDKFLEIYILAQILEKPEGADILKIEEKGIGIRAETLCRKCSMHRDAVHKAVEIGLKENKKTLPEEAQKKYDSLVRGQVKK